MLSCGGNYYDGREKFFESNLLDYDVIRLPLVYPYQLESAYYPENLYIYSNSGLGRMFHISAQADSINVHDSAICIYDASVQHGRYRIMNLKDTALSTHSSFPEFDTKCRELHISSRLYHTAQSYESWLRSDSLPWK